MRAITVVGKAGDVAGAVARRLGDAGGGRGRAIARRTMRNGRRTLAYARGRWQGVRYAAAGRHPAEDVSDDVLADRVRTDLGSVLHRLDLPKVHVTVERGVVTLHGDAGSLADVEAISKAVAAVSGVRGVRSALHVGLLPSNNRPSWGRRNAGPSPTLRRLLDAADRGGVEPERRAMAIGVVLRELGARMQAEDWRDLAAHLPRDARMLAGPRQDHPAAAHEDLVSAVSAGTGLPGPIVAQTVRAVTHELREIAPGAVASVTSALPPDVATPGPTRS